MEVRTVTVQNAYGQEFDFWAMVEIMDKEVIEQCNNKSYINEKPQSWFDRYCALHYKKYGEEFECAKENPVW